jgi:chaperonin cofactor prefoldin
MQTIQDDIMLIKMMAREIEEKLTKRIDHLEKKVEALEKINPKK